jgi:hypothetical protein
MRRLIAVLMALAPIDASALTKGQGTFARNFAMLAYATKRCPQLRLNELQLAQGVVALGLPKGALEPGGEIANEAQTQMGKLESAFGLQSDEEFCAFMEDGFGPGGTIASGFLKRR